MKCRVGVSVFISVPVLRFLRFVKKVAQNDEADPDTQPVRPPHTPNLSNSQLSPSGSFARKRETLGILSRMFPPFAGTTYCRVRAHLAPRIVMLRFVIL